MSARSRTVSVNSTPGASAPSRRTGAKSLDTPHVDPATVAMLDQLPGAVFLVNTDGRIRFRNATGDAWLPDGEHFAPVCASLPMPESFDGWSVELARLMESGRPLSFETALQPDERSCSVPLSIRCTPWRDAESGDVRGVLVLMVEAANGRDVQRQTEVSHRLASLGKLASQVAHELNNPLDGILRYVNLALRLVDEATPNPRLKKYLSESRTGLMRMVQVIGDLLEYSRSTDGAFDSANVNEVVEQAVKAVAEAAERHRVVIAVDFQHADMPFTCGNRLYQVCVNLFKNGIDAMPTGGRLSITTGVVARNVCVCVADTGSGLPEPVDRAFEAFFTTKPVGEGSGLGLAICKEFIEDMGGTITAGNDPAGGAVLTVRIPRSRFAEQPGLTKRVRPGRSAKAKAEA